MAKTITLKFPGTCRDCGAQLPAGSVARWYGRGKVYGTQCHEQKPQARAGSSYRYEDARADFEDARNDSADGDDRSMFADPGGNSALRAATRGNPRNLACPTCKRSNVLTPADVARGYQCNACADMAEGVGYGFAN